MSADTIASGKFVIPGYLHAEIGIRTIGGPLPAWVDTAFPVDQEPDVEIVILHDANLIEDPDGPAVQAMKASRARNRIIVASPRIDKVLPVYYHLMVVAPHDHLEFTAYALAALASGVLLVGLDLYDVFEAAKVKTAYGDPGDPGKLGTALALKGVANDKAALAVQDILRAFAWQQYDTAALIIQMVAEEDMPRFSQRGLDAFFTKATEDRFIKHYFVTAASASQSGIAVFAF